MSKTKKIVWTSFLVLVAAGALSGGVYYWWLIQPPPMPTNLDEALSLMASSRYKRLADSRKQPYMEKSREFFESMSEDDRKRMRERYQAEPELRDATRQAMEDRFASTAKEYALADDFKRKQMVDQFVGTMEMGRGRGMGPSGGGAPPGGGGQPRSSDPDAQARRQKIREEMEKRMHDRIEKGDPQKQAYMMVFMKAVMQRRKEMGLNDPHR